MNNLPRNTQYAILANPACRGVASGEAGPSTFVEMPLQISYFLCKTNPILSAVGGLQTQYVQRIMKINGSGESEKTNPIQTQSKKSQNEYKLTYSKGLQKKR